MFILFRIVTVLENMCALTEQYVDMIYNTTNVEFS